MGSWNSPPEVVGVYATPSPELNIPKLLPQIVVSGMIGVDVETVQLKVGSNSAAGGGSEVDFTSGLRRSSKQSRQGRSSSILGGESNGDILKSKLSSEFGGDSGRWGVMVQSMQLPLFWTPTRDGPGNIGMSMVDKSMGLFLFMACSVI